MAASAAASRARHAPRGSAASGARRSPRRRAIISFRARVSSKRAFALRVPSARAAAANAARHARAGSAASSPGDSVSSPAPARSAAPSRRASLKFGALAPPAAAPGPRAAREHRLSEAAHGGSRGGVRRTDERGVLQDVQDPVAGTGSAAGGLFLGACPPPPRPRSTRPLPPARRRRSRARSPGRTARGAPPATRPASRTRRPARSTAPPSAPRPRARARARVRLRAESRLGRRRRRVAARQGAHA